MIRATLFWIAMFCLSAFLARGEAWRQAFQLTMLFPAYDNEVIYRQIKGRVFSKLWLASALTGSTFVAGAIALLQSNEGFGIALMVAGVLVIVGVPSIHGYQLFHVAIEELGLQWPPAVATSEVRLREDKRHD